MTLNLFLELFVIAWNIGLILWNLAVQVWNAAVPLVGMLIYVFLEIFVTILNNVVQLLGQIDIYALLKPVMEILQSVVKILVEVIQALVSVAVPLIEAMGKIIGALINIVFKVVEALWPIVQWILDILFKLLEPILQVVVALVQWFFSIFSAAKLAQRSLLGLEELQGSGPFDRFHSQAYSSAYDSAIRYWDRKTYRDAKNLEIKTINAFSLRHPARSLDYYWTVHRPFLARVTYPGVSVFKGVYENPNGDSGQASRGARSLLAFAHERQLLSADELKELHEPALSHEEYWARFDKSPSDHLDWYHMQHNEKEHRRREIVERVEKKLVEQYGKERLETFIQGLDDTPIENVHRKLLAIETEGKKKEEDKHFFSDELDQPMECNSKMCGGKGKAMRHPVHKLREMSWKRKNQPYGGSKWKEPGESEASWNRRRFIHVTAWSQAALEGVDVLSYHMQNPLLKKHTRDMWKRLTGHDELHSFFEEKYEKYSNFYEYVHDNIPDLSELPLFKRLKQEDPEKDTRPYYSDFMKSVKVHRRRNAATGRKMLFVELPDEEEHSVHQRSLLEAGDTQGYEEAQRHARWHSNVREWISQLRNDPQKRYHAKVARKLFSIEDDEFDNGLYGEWKDRELDGTGFTSGGLPFAPNPIPDAQQINNESQRRNAVLNSQRPKPDASVPLFELLAETDCYTTPIRNPLCMPSFPESWSIGSTPQITWPPNATSDLDCSYLYCQPPRNLLDWQAYFSWCWIWDGIQTIRIIISAVSAPFTTSIGILNTKYGPWLGWLLEPLLAFPPGVEPEGIDWVCFAIFGPYSLWLLGFVGWMIYIFVVPLFMFFADLVISWLAFSAIFVAADVENVERLKQTDWFFYRTAADRQTNIAHPGRAAPTPSFRQPTGAEHVGTPDPSQGSSVGNFPAVQPSGAEVFSRQSPYSEPRMDARSRRAIEAFEEALLDAASELGMPSRLYSSGGRPTALGRAIDICFGWLGWIGGSSVASNHISMFERTFNPFLLSYQMSPYWMYQKLNYHRKRRKIDLHYSPVQGTYQRGFTERSQDDIGRALYPERFDKKRPPPRSDGDIV